MKRQRHTEDPIVFKLHQFELVSRVQEVFKSRSTSRPSTAGKTTTGKFVGSIEKKDSTLDQRSNVK